jgi:hypothetical protein
VSAGTGRCRWTPGSKRPARAPWRRRTSRADAEPRVPGMVEIAYCVSPRRRSRATVEPPGLRRVSAGCRQAGSAGAVRCPRCSPWRFNGCEPQHPRSVLINPTSAWDVTAAWRFGAASLAAATDRWWPGHPLRPARRHLPRRRVGAIVPWLRGQGDAFWSCAYVACRPSDTDVMSRDTVQGCPATSFTFGPVVRSRGSDRESGLASVVRCC